MAVGRRSVLASGVASLATPALLRLARADTSPFVTLKLHHAFSSVSCLHTNFLAPWARGIERQSGGRIRIDIYPSMALGGRPAGLFDQALDRAVDIVWAMPCDTPGRFPKIETFELPFVPPRRALVGCNTIEDFAAAHLIEEFREVHTICFSCADRGVLHANRPVRTVAEVKGLRLDVGTRFTAAAVALLGGRPVPMPSGQLPFAIAHHVVDGCILPWDMTPALKLDDLLRMHTDFADNALSTTTAVLAMNKTSYEKLPADLKKIIDDNSGHVAAGMAGTMWDLKAKAVADSVDQSSARIVTLDADAVARWRKAVRPVIDAWRKDMKARKADADRLLASVRDLSAKYADLPEPPAPPKPQVTEAKAEPEPPATADSPVSAPQPAGKAAPAPAPNVSVAAPPSPRATPPAAPATHWWQFWKSTPATASASPIAPPAQPTSHWWQFWKPAAAPAPVAGSHSTTQIVPAVPAPMVVPAHPSVSSAAAAIAKPVPAPIPAPPKPFDIPL